MLLDDIANHFVDMVRKDGLKAAETHYKHEKTVDLEKWQWDFEDGSKAIVWKVKPNVAVLA